jgi:Carboxypeptidase regulatory-like domain
VNQLRLAALVLTMAFVSACVPIHVAWIDWPTIDGRAVDILTGKPVAGATVAIHASGSDFSANTTTGPDGTFRFLQHTHDQWVSYQFDNVFPPAMISVNASGYGHFESRLDGAVSIDAIPLTPSH